MQDKRYFNDDYESDFTDHGKKVMRDQNGCFAEIDYFLLKMGIISEIPYETTFCQVESNLEHEGERISWNHSGGPPIF